MPDAALAPSALSAIPPPVTADRKTIVDVRVRTAADVQAAYGVMRTADLERSRNRALVQAAVDGAQPYSDAKSRSMGTYGRSNINPGIAERATFEETAPYNEVLEQMDILTSMPTKYGDEMMRGIWSPTLAEGFTLFLKRWPRFNFLWQFCVSLFVREGVSIACFQDERNWEWDIYGLQHFKFPNESLPDEDSLDMCGWSYKSNCQKLYKNIQNEEAAKKIGWNPEAVKAAIKQASQITSTDADMERMQQRWKANDVMDGAKAPQVEEIHLLVREVNGTVTHLCAQKTGDGPVFYEGKVKFRSMSRCMTIFKYGIGTDGFLHSIRGHTARIFPTVTGAVRTLNSFIDMAMFAATPHLEAANADAMLSLPFRKVGYMTMLQQGSKFLETHVPDFEENLIPLYTMLSGLFEGQSSGSRGGPKRDRMERMTNQQDRADRSNEGQLSTAAMALFFPALERHFREVARRVIRKDYRRDEPGGEAVWWLRNWLKEREVPLEALYAVDLDGMQVNTGVGKGSQGARQAAAEGVMANYYLLDEQAKQDALRMSITTLAGSSLAKKLVPVIPGQRPGQQVENAMLQNGFLCGGNPAQIATVQPLPDQDSAAHVQTHLTQLEALWPMTQQQDQRAALDAIQPTWEHTIADWQMMDPKNPLYKKAKQELREMSEWIGNTAKELAAEEDRQADNAARGDGSMNGANGTAAKDVGGEGPNMANFARAIDARAKLSYTVEKNQEELAHKKEMNALEVAGKVQAMRLKNVEAKQKLLQ